jgi:hypothetical protein
VTLPQNVDAYPLHDIITGRSVNGMLHLIKKTPIDWYSKKQAIVQMATHGFKSVAAHTSVERDLDQRLKLRYLGVPIHSRNYIFGDDKFDPAPSSINAIWLSPFTACVKPSLPRSLASIKSTEYESPLILLASIGATSKFGTATPFAILAGRYG